MSPQGDKYTDDDSKHDPVSEYDASFMSDTDGDGAKKSHSIDRRAVLFGTGAALASAAGGALIAGGVVKEIDTEHASSNKTQTVYYGKDTVPYYGKYQQGIDITPQSNQRLIGFNIKDGVTATELKKMMKLLTSDAGRLSQGEPSLGDSEPELSGLPAELTITFGFGRKFVEIVNPKKVPLWLRPLPHYRTDHLQKEYTGGDLCIQIASNNADTVVHAARMFMKSIRSFATMKWVQDGYRRNKVVTDSTVTHRNLLGQVDGTVNPRPGTEQFKKVVFINDDSWLKNGTSFIIRRTEFLMEKWDKVNRRGREEVMGRNLSNGAPLTGQKETDIPDLDAKTALGFPVIGQNAHIRRAKPSGEEVGIYRRGYNYDLPVPDYSVTQNSSKKDPASNSGLIFTCYQADPLAQFDPIQKRLADADLLNEWTIPIGSALFAIPPGTTRDGYIGQTLWEE